MAEWAACFGGAFLCLPMLYGGGKKLHYRSIAKQLHDAKSEKELESAISVASAQTDGLPVWQTMVFKSSLTKVHQCEKQARIRLETAFHDDIHESIDDLYAAVQDGKAKQPLQDAVHVANDLLQRVRTAPLLEQGHFQLALTLDTLQQTSQRADFACTAQRLVDAANGLAEANPLSEQISALQESLKEAEGPSLQCIICLEPKRQRCGAKCHPSNEHFVCGRCLREHTRHQVGQDGSGMQNAQGLVCCPGVGCEGIFPWQVIVMHCTSDVAEAMWQRRLEKELALQKAKIQAEESARMNKELLHLQGLTGENLKVEVQVRKIQEDVFTLKCPRCRVAFNDFDACAALTCANRECNCNFCAFCLRQCAGKKQAHYHVLHCSQRPPGMKGVFCKQSDFYEVHRARQEREARKHITWLKPDMQDLVRQRLQRDAQALGISL